MNKDKNIPGNEHSFDLPKDYFDSFNERLFLKLELEEELKEFPALSALDKALPFTTPDQYFENLNTSVENRITKEASVKVVTLNTFISKYKYTIAAVFVLAIGTGVFFNLYNKTASVKTDSTCMELACLTKEDIAGSNYLNQLSLSELEAVAGDAVQDSLNAEINKDVVNELIQHPEELNLTDDDIEL